MFSTFPKPNLDISITFILSSAYAINLNQSKILSFGKELMENIAFFACDTSLYFDAQTVKVSVLTTDPYTYNTLPLLLLVIQEHAIFHLF